MTTPIDVNRELENLSVRLSRVETDMKQQNVVLYEIRDFMIAARGSWKTVVGISGFAAAVGGLIVKFGGAMGIALLK